MIIIQSNIKNFFTSIGFFSRILICFAILMPPATAAQKIYEIDVTSIPGLAGSYLDSCSNERTKIFPPRLVGSAIIARCNPKSSDAASPTARLENVFECDGDIRNDDGRLKCSRNQNSALMGKAKSVLKVLHFNIYGSDLDQIGYETGYRYFLREAFKAGLAPDFFAGTLNGGGSQKLTDLMFNLLNANLKQKSEVINAASQSVYGMPASSKEMAVYMAQRTSFQDIVEAERKLLIADKTLLDITVNTVFRDAINRQPTAAERAKWTQREMTYSGMIRAFRQYLYSPQGASELTETIRRDFVDRGNKTPTPDQINQKIIEYTPKRKLSFEM